MPSKKEDPSTRSVDPKLAALFTSTLGKALPRAAPGRTREAQIDTSGEDDVSIGADSADDDVGDSAAHGAEPEKLPSSSISEKPSLSKPRKRKHADLDDDLEESYMRRLEKETTASRKKSSQQQQEKRTKLDGSAPVAEMEKKGRVAPLSGAEDDEDSDQADAAVEEGVLSDDEVEDAALPVIQHETMTKDNETVELEKASRTVFLGNVAISSITSKTDRRVLDAHLSSFIASMPTHDPPHRLESLRFRSTAFATAAIPKKAAFVKKELMESTTHSTNAYVVYSTPAAAREAVKQLNGTVVLDRHLRVDGVAHPTKVDHRRCVFVGNLGFVDDETSIKAAEDEESGRKPRKGKEPADAEEGLWRQFGKCGTVESVRVVRDKITRVGKGFGYVQFNDQNAVEKALLLNGKKFPPTLPRILRVTRAKNPAKTASRADDGKVRAIRPKGRPAQKPDSNAQSLSGRVGKLLGRAGAAQMRRKGVKGESDAPQRGKRAKPSIRAPESFVFEGYRAKANGSNPVSGLKSKKKGGKPQTRSGKRGAAFKAAKRK
ncbi:Nucleolar protein 12 [Agyrium rufum]|nr:Nucleolar protein 12 [Agyrium rufum]